MRRPARHEVGGVAEVVAGVDVPVLRGDDPRVVALADDLGHRLGDDVAAAHAEGAALAEVGLDVHDDECAGGHRSSLSYTVGMAGSPRESCSADGGSSASVAACRSRAASSGSRPTTSPSLTSSTSSGRSLPSSAGQVAMPITSASATPLGLRRRSDHLRPPTLILSLLALATCTMVPSSELRDTSL